MDIRGPLHELLESYPDIDASARPVDLKIGANLELAGKLHYDVQSELDEAGGGHITIKLGLRYPPKLYSDRVTAVISEIRQSLYTQFPELRERVADGRMQLRIEACTSDEVEPYNIK